MGNPTVRGRYATTIFGVFIFMGIQRERERERGQK